MFRTVLTFCMVVMLGVIGCNKKESPSSEATKAIDRAVKENVPEVPAGATAASAPSANAAKIDCEKLLPVEIRNKYFKGFSMKQEQSCPNCPEFCKLSENPDDKTGPILMADCRWNDKPTWFEETTKVLEQQKSYQKIEGLGRLAFSAMKMQVIFIPQKFNCALSITWMNGGDKLASLGKEIDANLTPAALGM